MNSNINYSYSKKANTYFHSHILRLTENTYPVQLNPPGNQRNMEYKTFIVLLIVSEGGGAGTYKTALHKLCCMLPANQSATP